MTFSSFIQQLLDMTVFCSCRPTHHFCGKNRSCQSKDLMWSWSVNTTGLAWFQWVRRRSSRASCWWRVGGTCLFRILFRGSCVGVVEWAQVVLLQLFPEFSCMLYDDPVGVGGNVVLLVKLRQICIVLGVDSLDAGVTYRSNEASNSTPANIMAINIDYENQTMLYH